jgi:anti-sigma B factor antagonist
VGGELDIATAPRMIAALNDALSDMDSPLIVDLSDVVFMDSTGLALLMNARRRVMRRGQGFAIVCPAGPISRVFEIADMVDSLRVFRDEESARVAATERARA